MWINAPNACRPFSLMHHLRDLGMAATNSFFEVEIPKLTEIDLNPYSIFGIPFCELRILSLLGCELNEWSWQVYELNGNLLEVAVVRKALLVTKDYTDWHILSLRQWLQETTYFFGTFISTILVILRYTSAHYNRTSNWSLKFELNKSTWQC